MRILFIGDVVGKAGMHALSSFLPPLLSRWNVDVTIVNGENSADAGFGITRDTYKAIRDAGADAVDFSAITPGDRKEALEVANQGSRLIRPINYVPGTPGSGLVEINTGKGKRALVINALGRLFMEPSDDPFGAVSRDSRDTSAGARRRCDRARLPLRGNRRKAGHGPFLRRTS